jgi:hypothetical protein
VQQADGVLFVVVGAEGVGADHLGQVAGLVREGADLGRISCSTTSTPASAACQAASDPAMPPPTKTPDITLAELCQRLSERGIAASTSSLWRFFQRHAITRKKRPDTPSSRIARTF